MKEEKIKIEFDTYGHPIEPESKKEGLLTKIWNKTIFPDKIKKKREEREWQEKIKAEVKEEMRQELKDEYKKILKEEELNKLKGVKTGKGKGILSGIANEFKAMGDAVGGKDIGAMMGTGRGMNTEFILGKNEIENHKPVKKSRHVKRKKKPIQQPQQPKQETYEDKIRRMLQ